MISWINYEKETRLEHMAKLMEHVRLPLLPRDYLVQVCAGLSTLILGLQRPPWLHGMVEFNRSSVYVGGTNQWG